MRRLVVVALAAVVAVPGAWGAWWLWRATHPVLPDDTVAGWLPAVVVAAGNHGELSEPFGVAVAADGTIFLSDAGDAHAIRRLAPDGTMQLVAGGRRGFADGVGTDAAFDTPSHLALDESGNLYVADTGNHAIRRVTPDGVVTTVAGDGIPGAGEGSSARLNGPVGVAVDRAGRVVVADTYNDRIVRLDREGVVTIAGAGTPGFVDGPAAATAFDTPSGVAVLEDGSIAVADTGNDALRRIGLDGAVTTLDAVESSSFNTALWRPIGIVAASGGRIYVTDHRSRVLEIAGGRRRVLAGGDPGFAAGLGTAAAFREPAGIAVSRSGRVVVADAGNALLRVLDLPERIGGWLPAPPRRHPGFDLERFARAPLVWPVEPQDGPHEVAGTLGEPRGNPGGDGRERFHAGVDVRAVQGSTVLAVRDGVIRAVLPAGAVGTLSEFITIGPLTYIHLRVGRDRADRAIANWADVLPDPISGKPARVRVRRGTHIAAGEAIGSVNRFQHVHLNVGPPGEEANALLVGFPNVVDTVPPVIAPKGITLTDLTGTPLTEHCRGTARGSRSRPHRRGRVRPDERQPATPAARALSCGLPGAECRRLASARLCESPTVDRLRSPAAGSRRAAHAVRAGERHPVLRHAPDAISLRADDAGRSGHGRSGALDARSAPRQLPGQGPRRGRRRQPGSGSPRPAGRDSPRPVVTAAREERGFGRVSSSWGRFRQVGLRLDGFVGFSGFSGLVYAIDNLSQPDNLT